MTKEIWLDLDGTLANLYAVENWLDYLHAEDTHPYVVAAPMLNLSLLARQLNRAQRAGWKLGIISWTSKGGSELYNTAVELAKRGWLAKHLPSVEWDEIKIVRYGTNKRKACGGGLLFDDEEPNRLTWGEGAYHPAHILEVLKKLTNEG